MDSINRATSLPSKSLTLPLTGLKGWGAQLALVASAVLLPAAAHLMGAPVRWLLPMHWPVLLAGILYGWRGGLLVGALSPTSNWLITGFPLPLVLPAMTLELATYGLVAGLLRERLGWNGFSSTAGAVIAGRLVFIATVWMTAGYQGAFGGYLIAAMTPGFVAGVAQVGVMGLVGLSKDKSVN